MSGIIINAVLILLTVVFGRMVHNAGKPYNTVLFAFHKIIAIGFIVYMILIIIPHTDILDILGSLKYSIIASAIFAIILLVSGALMALDKLAVKMLIIHRLSTIFFLISVSFLFYSMI